MAISFLCPSCKSPFRVPDDQAGKHGKCQKCGSVFVIPTPAAAPPIATSSLPPTPAPARIPPPPRTTSRAKPQPEPEAVRPRKTEAKPAAEPQPEAIRKRRPASKADSFADLDRAPPSRKQLSPRSKKLLLFGGLGCGALAFLLLVAGGVAWWFLSSSGLPSEARYLPNDAQYVASIRLEKVRDSKEYARLKHELPDSDADIEKSFEREYGVSFANAERLSVAGDFNTADGKDSTVTIVRTNKAFSASDIRSNRKAPEFMKNHQYREVAVGKQKIYEETFELAPGQTETGKAFCIPENKVVLFGSTDRLRAILERDKKPELAEALQNALKEADFSQDFVVAVNLKAVRNSKGADMAIDLLEVKAGGARELIQSVDSFTMQGSLGSTVKVQATILCKDAKSAEDNRKLLEGGLVQLKNHLKTEKDVPTEVQTVIESVKVTTNGVKVTASVEYKFDPLLDILKEANKKKKAERVQDSKG